MKNKTKITITITILAIYFVSVISLASALTIESVLTSPEKIAPGETSSISILLKNNADIDIQDVSVELDFTNVPLAPYDSGSEFSTDEIREGKIKEAEFKIIASNDAKSGIYKIPVKINYNEDDVPKTKQSLISIMINSPPAIELSIEDGLLLKGKENKITVKIINKGLGDAKFLEVEVGESSYYDLISQNKIYIGDTDSNDFQTAEFNILFKEKIPDKINLPISVHYKDVTSKEYSYDTDLNLRAYSQKQATDLGLIKQNYTGYIIILVVLVIIIFFIYRIIRGRRKRSSEN